MYVQFLLQSSPEWYWEGALHGCPTRLASWPRRHSPDHFSALSLLWALLGGAAVSPSRIKTASLLTACYNRGDLPPAQGASAEPIWASCASSRDLGQRELVQTRWCRAVLTKSFVSDPGISCLSPAFMRE